MADFMDTIKSTPSGVNVTDQSGNFVGGTGSNRAITPKAYLAGIVCPRFDAPISEKLEWLQSSAARGRAFLSAQPGFDFITSAALVLQGLMPKDRATSEHNLNFLKRQVKEIIATLGNLKPEWRYGSPANDAEYVEALVNDLNMRLKVWWKGDTFPADSIKKALQFAATGCGYISPVWSAELLGSNQSDIELKVFGPEDVLIDQITDDWDLNKAYAVTLYERVPTIRMRQLWPEQEESIFPNVMSLTDESGRGTGTTPNGARGFFKSSALYSLFSGGTGITDNKQQGGGSRQLRTKISHNQTLATDVYFTYINDTSPNLTGEIVWASQITVTDKSHQLNAVGDYPIPPVGIAVKFKESSEAPPKIYSPQRCMLYPSRRLIIWTQDAILYDGPSIYHHGKVPLVKLQFDPQVWNYLGGNIVEENRTADQGFSKVLGTWFKMFRLRANPPVEFDTSEISEKEMSKRDLSAEGAKYPRKGFAANQPAIRPIHTAQHLQIGDEAVSMLGYLEQRLNHNLGTADFQSLMKMQGIVDGDGLEKLLTALGPMLSDYASYLEMSLTKLGYLCMWTWLQFNTSAIKVSRGEMLLSSEVDLEPGTSIPAQIGGVDELTNSCFFHRMRCVAQKMRFNIVPDSVFQVTDWKRKMLAFQLYREPNFPMDSKTIADILGVEGFGDIDGDTVIERWANERRMMMPFQSQLQVEAMQQQMVGQAVAQVQAQIAAQMAAQQIQQQTGLMQTPQQQAALDGQEVDPDDPFYGALGQLAQVGGLGGLQGLQEQLGASNTPGRPPSGQVTPQIETKVNGDGTERQTITES